MSELALCALFEYLAYVIGLGHYTYFRLLGRGSSQSDVYRRADCCDVESTAMTLIKCRNNVVGPYARFLIIDNHVKNRKCGNSVSISSLTGECAAQKL